MSSARYYAEYESFIDSVRKYTAKEILPLVADWERDAHFPNSALEPLGIPSPPIQVPITPPPAYPADYRSIPQPERSAETQPRLAIIISP